MRDMLLCTSRILVGWYRN